jgi:hypothetical protein
VRRCPICGTKYQPIRPTQKCCTDPDCAATMGRQIAEKAQRLRDRQQKQAQKTPSQRMADTQKIFNAAVRARDAGLPCISCGRPANWDGQWHASHFKSVGANSALRFNLWNVAKSCSVCNNHLSGNIDGYRSGIVSRYGQSRIDWLDSAPRVRRYSVEYLERLECVLKKLLKRWKKRAGSCAA